MARDATTQALSASGRTQAFFRNNAGTATQVGSTTNVYGPNGAAAAVSYSPSGSSVNVQVTAASSDTVDWTAYVYRFDSQL